jgi:predicted nucleic acid-binding protein
LLEVIRTSPEYIVLQATAPLFDAGLTLHAQRPDKEWSLTDCISFVVMEQRGIAEALAYDHHFEQAGFVALLRRDP